MASRKALRSAVLLLVVAPAVFSLAAKTAAGTGSKAKAGHARPQAKSVHTGGFDVRRFAAKGVKRGLPRLAADPSAQQRRLAAESYVATLSTQLGEEVRVTWNDFGLPASLFAERAALTAPSGRAPAAVALEFLRSHPALFPLSEAAIGGLELVSESRSGAATFLTFHQTFQGARVFRGLVQVTVDGSGRVLRVGAGDLLLNDNLDATPKLSPEQAVQPALRHYGKPAARSLTALPSAAGRHRFVNPIRPKYSPAIAEPAVFPLSAESARPAWRLYLHLGRGRVYELLIDSANGVLLYSQNIVHTAARVRVWKESPLKGPREVVELPEAWLPAATTVTTGNSVDAYLDSDVLEGPDPITTSELKNGRAFSDTQQFIFLAGEGSTGQDPTEFKAASVTNLFYFVNLAHDYFYSLGFDEASGNFQTDNFSIGGVGHDAVLAEAQHVFIAGQGAFFFTLPDGEPPRMEVGIDPGALDEPTDDRDGAYDGQVVVHEYAHGVGDRLIGGPAEVTCLLNNMQSTALAEGYADYFAISYFNDPVLGAYLGRSETSGYRRSSYEGHPLTYEDLGNQGFEQHNDGEVWAASLWDLRTVLGKDVTDKLIVDSLKTVPCKPTMVDARDAILTADAAANGGANRQKIWEVFAKHGLGFSARAVDGFAGFEAIVFDAAYDMPPELVPGNRSPKVTSKPTGYASLGEKYVYAINASDPNGDQLKYELVEGPERMTVNASNGRVEWVAGFTAGRAKISITDGKGGKVIHGIVIPVITLLGPGVPVAIDGPLDSFGLALLNAPAGKEVLQVTLRQGTGDPDLMLIDPVFDLYGMSDREGSAETISVAGPQEGIWAVIVRGYEAYRNVKLTASFPVLELLAPGAVKSGLAGEETSETFYRITVPDNASRLRVNTTGGTGDADLYVRLGKVPVCISLFTLCQFDDFSIEFGNEEAVSVPDVSPGEWYINLRGYEVYSGVTLSVSLLGPDFSAESVTNGASFLPPVGPGAIFTIFGKKLAAAEAAAATVPLPTTLDTASVTVNGVPAPLYYVSPTQINAQLPFEAQPGEATVIAKSGDLSSDPIKITVLPSAPGIFLYGSNRAVVVNHEDGSLNDPAHPAKVGSYIVTYLTGVSPLDNPVATGAPAPLEPLSRCTLSHSATVGGKPAEMIYLGLTANFVGLGQANIKVPELPSGDHALQITIGSVISNGPLITVAAN